MFIKVISNSLGIFLILIKLSESAYVGYGKDDYHHHSVASSYMHFHGPVEGEEHEIQVPHVELLYDHGSHKNHFHQGHVKGHTFDYKAHPKYEYSYGVKDSHTGDFHSQKEHRDGSSVTGEYSIKEPSGNVRVVTYTADKDGFRAVVHNSGKNVIPVASYPDNSKGHERISNEEEQQYLQEYPVSF